jgi:hypothetical protein
MIALSLRNTFFFLAVGSLAQDFISLLMALWTLSFCAGEPFVVMELVV